jgi:hypothetical protein
MIDLYVFVTAVRAAGAAKTCCNCGDISVLEEADYRRALTTAYFWFYFMCSH